MVFITTSACRGLLSTAPESMDAAVRHHYVADVNERWVGHPGGQSARSQGILWRPCHHRLHNHGHPMVLIIHAGTTAATVSTRTSTRDHHKPCLQLLYPKFRAVIPGMLPNMPNMLPNMFNLPNLGQPLPMTQQATRRARRVYVGGLSPSANEQTVALFFNQVMAAIGGNTVGIGDAVVNVYINHGKNFAFVEMRSVEEASNAMALDGILFEGAPVKVRRPTDYNPSHAAVLGPSQPNPNLNLAAVGLTPGLAGGMEGPDRIFVGGLPYYFTEDQVRELLETFGPLRGFDIVKDMETGNSKGYAFCLYQDVSVTDIACAALNGIKLGDRTRTVRRANQGSEPRPEQESVLLQAQKEAQMKSDSCTKSVEPYRGRWFA